MHRNRWRRILDLARERDEAAGCPTVRLHRPGAPVTAGWHGRGPLQQPGQVGPERLAQLRERAVDRALERGHIGALELEGGGERDGTLHGEPLPLLGE